MYDNPNRQTYTFPVADAGAGTVTMKITGPKGKSGKVQDYGLHSITEAFTATTTGSVMSVGKSGTLAAYGANLAVGTAAIGATKSMRNTILSLGDLNEYVPAQIPADTEVLFTITAPTGGTPAGIGTPFLTIDWDW